MAAPVVGDDAEAVVEEEHHLGVPVVRRERPAVAENDGLTLAPILVEDLDAVLGLDEGHCSLRLYQSLGDRHTTSGRPGAI
jgi:hypothetical protein